MFRVVSQDIKMRVLDAVALVLRKKGSHTWSVPSDATVYSAVRMMAEHDVGALLVMENNQLVGVVSERDYARKVILMGRSSRRTAVSKIMGTPLLTISPECHVDEALMLMTTNQIRHLPVLSHEKVLGMVSIGDLVTSIVVSQYPKSEHLEQHIEGQYHY
jgi:signal-transduction protein with cAMP-binding, CBS, and nucleotidyltransferase domain